MLVSARLWMVRKAVVRRLHIRRAQGLCLIEPMCALVAEHVYLILLSCGRRGLISACRLESNPIPYSLPMVGKSRKIAELDAMTAPVKRQKKECRDVEEQVSRIIKLHFSGPQWTDAAVNFQARNGKTLRQTLLDEKAAKGDRGRISSSRIKELQSLFAPAAGAARTLIVKSAEEPVNPEFRQALVLASHPNPGRRSRSHLLSYLQHRIILNQRETVGLMRCIEGTNIYTSAATRQFILEIAKYIMDVGLKELFPDEVNFLRELWDHPLASTYCVARKDGVDTTQFVELYGTVLGIVCNVEDLVTLVDNTGEWHTVDATLKRVTCFFAGGPARVWCGCADHCCGNLPN